MHYLVARYIGEKFGCTFRFPERDDAIRFMMNQYELALDDGFDVCGDPLDGHFTYAQDGHEETLVLSETDRLSGRAVVPRSSDRRPRPLP